MAEDDAVEVTVASSRPAVVAAWSARLASEPGLRLAGAAVSDLQALDACLGACTSQVLLLDVASLEWLSTEAWLRLRARYPDLRVLLVCDSAGPRLVELVLSHRFQGYLVTHDPTDLCVKAIVGVRRGELWLPRAGLAEALYLRCGYRGELPAVEGLDRLAQRGSLTQREQQIVVCLHKGATNTEIARELGIKKDTVKKHLRSLFGKLGVHRRAEVALLHEAGALNAAPPRARGL